MGAIRRSTEVKKPGKSVLSVSAHQEAMAIMQLWVVPCQDSEELAE